MTGGTGYNNSKLKNNSSLLNPVVPTPTKTSRSAICRPGVTFASVVAKADSGASHHYFCPQDETVLKNLHSVNNSASVHLPDSTTIQSTHCGLLPITKNLSSRAKTVHLLPHLKSASLVSPLGQVCEDDCKIILDKHSLTATKNGHVVLTGSCNLHDGLLDVSLTTINTQPTSQSSTTTAPTNLLQKANVIIRKNQTTKELANYLHATCSSPAVSFFLKAIKNGFLLSWPGIDLIKESDLTPSLATAKGHLDQERFNLQSTQQPMTPEDSPLGHLITVPTRNEHTAPSTSSPDILVGPKNKTQQCLAIIQQFDKKAYIDLAGFFLW